MVTPRALPTSAVPEPGPLLVVDLGGTRLRTAVFDAAGEMVRHAAIPTPPRRPRALIEAMAEALSGPGPGVVGAVVGVAGPVSYANGVPLSLPNLRSWEGHVSAPLLANAAGVPVALANDADLAALGEHRYGAGRGVSDMLYVTVSTGIGAGVILNGRLVHGRRSIGEIGHTLVDLRSTRTLQQLGSGTALEALTGVDGEEAARRAHRGDPGAREAFERVGGVVARGVLNAALSFVPERVVIGGGVARSGELLLEPVRHLLQTEGARWGLVPELATAELGDDGGLRGGFAFWHDLTTAAATPPRDLPFVAVPVR